MKKFSVGYIGNYAPIPEYISHNERMELKEIIAESDKISNELVTLSLIRDVPLSGVVTKEELARQLNASDVDFWVMCSFWRIIPASRLKNKEIYNIHYAALPCYKGRHPTYWATVKGELRLGITLHLINDEMDCGNIVAQEYAEYYYWMNENDIFQALTDKVPSLLKRLVDYKLTEKDLPSIMPGSYFAPVSEEDYTIFLDKDSPAVIFNKVRAQTKYRGARLMHGGYEYWIKRLMFGKIGSAKEDAGEIEIPYRDGLCLIISEYEKAND